LPAAIDDGVNAAVNPEGKLEAASVTEAGKVLPTVGLMVKLNVAVAPGWTVCDDPFDPTVRVKSWTVSTNAALVAALKFESPLYAAVMEWVPEPSDETVMVATPPLTFPVPMDVPPSEKTTVPLGVLVDDPTVAVRVTEL